MEAERMLPRAFNALDLAGTGEIRAMERFGVLREQREAIAGAGRRVHGRC